MITTLILIWCSGFAGGLATALLLGCCRCAARPLPSVEDVAARDARAFPVQSSKFPNPEKNYDRQP